MVDLWKALSGGFMYSGGKEKAIHHHKVSYGDVINRNYNTCPACGGGILCTLKQHLSENHGAGLLNNRSDRRDGSNTGYIVLSHVFCRNVRGAYHIM